jgi:hypothetical protein
VTPVQNTVSRGVNWVTGYFRAMKYRSNLEYEYEQALIRTDNEDQTVTVSRPTELIYQGEKFNILRTYETTNAMIEVTVGL